MAASQSVVNVSTGAIHDFVLAGAFPSYSLTKNAGTLGIQLIAKDVRPDDMQVVSFNPGLVWTDMTSNLLEKDKFEWTSGSWRKPLPPNSFQSLMRGYLLEDLPGQFTVWAASEEAAFLHGRYVWSEWDVEELRVGPVRDRLEQEPRFLQIGVFGL